MRNYLVSALIGCIIILVLFNDYNINKVRHYERALDAVIAERMAYVDDWNSTKELLEYEYNEKVKEVKLNVTRANNTIDRLHEELSKASRSNSTTRDSESKLDTSTRDMCPDLFKRIADRAREYAEYSDELLRRGVVCERLGNVGYKKGS